MNLYEEPVDSNERAPYAWTITRDALCEPGCDPDNPGEPLIHPSESEKGTCGPRHASRRNLARIASDWDPNDLNIYEFRMYDGDGGLNYEGLYVGPDDEKMFAPLEDFGKPNAGCTSIHYFLPTDAPREERSWEQL